MFIFYYLAHPRAKLGWRGGRILTPTQDFDPQTKEANTVEEVSMNSEQLEKHNSIF